jgi:4'-phosphopantetheinyl transferase
VQVRLWKAVAARGDIHVWPIPIAAVVPRVTSLHALLADSERDAAARFRFDRDRVRFICRRGAVRSILARYVGMSPESLQFRRGPHGKPELLDAPPRLQFNVSGSGDLAVLAIGLDGRVGVDVEALRSIPNAEGVAAICFSAAERTALAGTTGADRHVAFLSGWTRKEAFVKAVGEGLSYPLQEFDVTLRPGEAARLLRIRGDAHAASRWSMAAFTPSAGYVAAVAVEGQRCRVITPRLWEDHA